MYIRNTVIEADGMRYYILTPRGSVAFAFGLDDDSARTTFDIYDYGYSKAPRQPTPEEYEYVIRAVLIVGVHPTMINIYE